MIGVMSGVKSENCLSSRIGGTLSVRQKGRTQINGQETENIYNVQVLYLIVYKRALLLNSLQELIQLFEWL